MMFFWYYAWLFVSDAETDKTIRVRTLWGLAKEAEYMWEETKVSVVCSSVI